MCMYVRVCVCLCVYVGVSVGAHVCVKYIYQEIFTKISIYIYNNISREEEQ